MRNIVVITAIAVILFPFAGLTQDIPAEVQLQQAHALLEQGDKQRDAGDANQAISLYSEAQSTYRTLAHKYPNWQTSVVRFRTVYCNDQIEAMLKKLSDGTREKTSQSSPAQITSTGNSNEVESALASAKKLLKEGKHVEARVFLLRAINIAPDNNSIRLLLSIAQCEAGKYNDAAYILEELIAEDDSNTKAHTLLGAACLALGDITKAKSETLRALQLDPDMKEANFNMAQILAVSNDPDKASAVKYYKKALTLGAIRNASLELQLQ